MDELYLIYVNRIGENYKGQMVYEFIFSDTTKDVDGEDWDMYPAAGRPKPPHSSHINKVGVLTSEIVLELIQDNSILAVWDAVDGCIALAYENINNYDSYPEHRLVFQYGVTLKYVEEQLYEKDLILNYTKMSHDKQI